MRMSVGRIGMMNERIKELALDAGLLNYIDHETPRHYFINGHAEQEDVVKFAQLIIQECASLFPQQFTDEQYKRRIDKTIRKHFGLQ